MVAFLFGFDFDFEELSNGAPKEHMLVQRA